MGTIAARQCQAILENMLNVFAIEVLAAFQALSFRKPLLPGEGVARAVAFLEAKGLRPFTDDRVMYTDVHHVRELLRELPPTKAGGSA